MRPPAKLRSPPWPAVLAGLGTLVACVLANLPHLRAAAAWGDTWALLLNSARFYPVAPGEWFTRGFADYFVNYPEATRPYTSFVRPVVNASFWLESWLADGPNSLAFLLTNYLGHAACTALVFVVGVRLGGLGPGRALLAAVLFGGSLSSVELMASPAFRADMLGALFGVAGLLCVHRWLAGGGLAWVPAAVLLLTLAVLSKETALPAPLMAAGAALLLPGERTGGPRRAAAAALLLPLAVFAAARALGPESGAYVSLSGVRIHASETVSSAFFPAAGVLEVLALFRGQLPPGTAPWMPVALAMNLAAWTLALPAMLRRDPAAMRLGGLCAGALALPFLLSPEPRMMYFGQMFTLPLLALVLPDERRVATALAALALVAGPARTLARMSASQEALVVTDHDSRALQEVLDRRLRDPAVRRVYLVNDLTGDYAAAAMLRAHAISAGRQDVALRVVSSLGRTGNESTGRMEVRRVPGGLLILQSCAAPCGFRYPGVLPENQALLGTAEVRYRRAESHAMEIELVTPARDFLLVGFDPGRPGVHLLGPGDAAWRPATSGR